MVKLLEHLSIADIKQVKEGVLLFIRNPKEFSIRSNDYFVQYVFETNAFSNSSVTLQSFPVFSKLERIAKAN